MSRKWPIPTDTDRTLHCVGDVHIGGLEQRRQDLLLADLLRPSVPSLAHHLQLGDMVNTPGAAEDAAAVAFMDQIAARAGGDWHTVIGNHDIWSNARTSDQAAAAYGMPAGNYTVDLGYAVLVCLAPTTLGANQADMPLDTAWLNSALLANSDRPCMIAAHAPLHETVSPEGTNADYWTSMDGGFYVYNDTEVRTVLADNPNSKVWLSGHTHSPLASTDVVKRERVAPGAHYLAHVNTSSIIYTRKNVVEWTASLATAYVTFLDTKVEVRFRDHGRAQWVGSGQDLVRAWSIDI